jgi:DNA-binding NarL/FixJ family response regulator
MKIRARLLLSDDSTLVKNNLKRLFLHMDNIDIYEAEDVDSTIKQLDALKPDILLLDLKMPGGSGTDVLEYLRYFSHKPVIIILTNFAEKENRERCLKMGAHYFFDKSEEHKDAIGLIKRIADASTLGVQIQKEESR